MIPQNTLEQGTRLNDNYRRHRTINFQSDPQFEANRTRAENPRGSRAARVSPRHGRGYSEPALPAGGRARQGGFSLLEVVVAFAILALSLGLLLQIFSRALNTTVLSGIYSRATTLAEARLNAVGVDIPLELGSYSGDPEDGLSWQVSIDPYELGDVLWEPVLEPLRVTSVVSWEEAGGRHQVALTTLRLAESTDTPGLDGANNQAEQQPRQGAADP